MFSLRLTRTSAFIVFRYRDDFGARLLCEAVVQLDMVDVDRVVGKLFEVLEHLNDLCSVVTIAGCSQGIFIIFVRLRAGDDITGEDEGSTRLL